jgi:hypothetical protein
MIYKSIIIFETSIDTILRLMFYVRLHVRIPNKEDYLKNTNKKRNKSKN